MGSAARFALRVPPVAPFFSEIEMRAQRHDLSGASRRLMGAAIIAGLVAPGQALAGGLLAYEIGTADVALASAGYGARAQDASTIFTNPAGMTRLEGSQVLLAPQLLYGNVGFSIGSGTSSALGTDDGGNPIGWFPSGGSFFSYSVSHDLKLGFGAAGSFGLGEAYHDNWVGRYYVQAATLIGLSLLPSIAYRLHDKFSAGLAVNVMYGVLKEQVAINNIGGAPDAQLKVDSTTWGWGLNLGLLYEADSETRFGLTYNSRVKLGFSGPAQFSGLQPGLQALLGAAGLLTATITADLIVPQQVLLGAFHQIDARWAIMGNVSWQQWSTFGMPVIGINNTSNPASLTFNLHYKDTWHGAAGAQVRLSDPWLLNFGIAYDSGFQDSSKVSPMLPVNSAWRLGIGAQDQVGETFSWGVAAEYMYGGTLKVNEQSSVPVAVGGRGDLVGSYDNTGIVFFAGHVEWTF